jgi:hypothetical protein
MKKVLCVLILIAAGCSGPVTSTGVYHGKLVDVNWGGIFFNSCEIKQQTSAMNSRDDRSSSRSATLCGELRSKIGQEITVEYETHLWPSIKLDTADEVIAVK